MFFEELGGARGSYWELIKKKTVQGLELQRENTQHWAKETETGSGHKKKKENPKDYRFEFFFQTTPKRVFH